MCSLWWKELENEVDNFRQNEVERQLEHYLTCYGNAAYCCQFFVWVYLKIKWVSNFFGFWLHAILMDYFSLLLRHLHVPVVEAVKEKERKKQLRVRFQKGFSWGVRLVDVGCVIWGIPKFSKVSLLKFDHRPDDFRGVHKFEIDLMKICIVLTISEFWCEKLEIFLSALASLISNLAKYLILGFLSGWNVAEKRLDLRRLQRESNRSQFLKGQNWRLSHLEMFSFQMMFVLWVVAWLVWNQAAQSIEQA